MNIKQTLEGTSLLLELEGRLDTSTSPELEAQINDRIDVLTELTLDFAGIDYISSSGLRVLLSAQKKMNAKGKMTVRNVNETVSEIFDITGFSEILNVE